MKYFRKHPDLLIIGNYPTSTKRVRHVRQTSPQELSKILIRTITSLLRQKKILLLTDAPEEIHTGCITRTSWLYAQPLSLQRLISRLIYNFQTDTVCLLYHSDLFAPWWLLITAVFTPILLGILRLTGKRTVIVFLTTPSLSSHPKLAQAVLYFLRMASRRTLSALASVAITSETSRAVRSLKERREVGKIITDTLFPSPTHALGLASILESHP